MSRSITFYFSVLSIWSYIGHGRIRDFAAATGIAFDLKPISLGELFARSGGVKLRDRHISRQRYRDFEVKRWCARLGVGLDLDSPFLPVDATLADCTVIAALRDGHDVDDLLLSFHEAAFLHRQNIAAPQTLARIADQCGLPGTRLVETAAGEPIAAIYRQNIADAITDNVFGAPSFVLDGEVFWGQDRLEFLAEAVTTGRRPFTADV